MGVLCTWVKLLRGWKLQRERVAKGEGRLDFDIFVQDPPQVLSYATEFRPHNLAAISGEGRNCKVFFLGGGDSPKMPGINIGQTFGLMKYHVNPVDRTTAIAYSRTEPTPRTACYR